MLTILLIVYIIGVVVYAVATFFALCVVSAVGLSGPSFRMIAWNIPLAVFWPVWILIGIYRKVKE